MYRLNELDSLSIESWMREIGKRRVLGKKELVERVLTKDGQEVLRPSLIEAPFILPGSKDSETWDQTDFVLYAEERGCLAYGDPRRPDSCKQYPLDL